jgi:hypothetical protein
MREKRAGVILDLGKKRNTTKRSLTVEPALAMQNKHAKKKSRQSPAPMPKKLQRKNMGQSGQGKQKKTKKGPEPLGGQGATKESRL